MTADLRGDLGPVGDQGHRRTCVAFATTAAHEHKRADGVARSVEALTWAIRQVTGPQPTEDCTILEADTALSGTGQPPLNTWPIYNPSRPADPPAGTMPACAAGNLDPLEPSRQELERLLGAGTPVIVVIRLFENVHRAAETGDVVDLPPPGMQPLDDHAVLAVGFSDEGLVVRNSWGDGWADAGHALLRWAFVEQHLIDAALIRL